MNFSNIKYESDEGIATVTLNCPQYLNAWTPEMGMELFVALEHAANDKEVRAIILTGAGSGFCSGMNKNNLTKVTENSHRKRQIVKENYLGGSSREDFNGIFTYFPAIGKPVIAAINGAVAGSGLVLALACDLRFASAGAMFTTSFSRLGLNAEHGMDWLLPRLIGMGHAQDLLLSGRKIAAEEALRIGLVNQIYPQAELLDRTRQYAMELVRFCSPRSMRIIKRQIWESQFYTLEEAVTIGNREMLMSFQSDDFKEGLAHSKEKRCPHFTGE